MAKKDISLEAFNLVKLFWNFLKLAFSSSICPILIGKIISSLNPSILSQNYLITTCLLLSEFRIRLDRMLVSLSVVSCLFGVLKDIILLLTINPALPFVKSLTDCFFFKRFSALSYLRIQSYFMSFFRLLSFFLWLTLVLNLLSLWDFILCAKLIFWLEIEGSRELGTALVSW